MRSLRASTVLTKQGVVVDSTQKVFFWKCGAHCACSAKEERWCFWVRVSIKAFAHGSLQAPPLTHQLWKERNRKPQTLHQSRFALIGQNSSFTREGSCQDARWRILIGTEDELGRPICLAETSAGRLGWGQLLFWHALSGLILNRQIWKRDLESRVAAGVQVRQIGWFGALVDPREVENIHLFWGVGSRGFGLRPPCMCNRLYFLVYWIRCGGDVGRGVMFAFLFRIIIQPTHSRSICSKISFDKQNQSLCPTTSSTWQRSCWIFRLSKPRFALTKAVWKAQEQSPARFHRVRAPANKPRKCWQWQPSEKAQIDRSRQWAEQATRFYQPPTRPWIIISISRLQKGAADAEGRAAVAAEMKRDICPRLSFDWGRVIQAPAPPWSNSCFCEENKWGGVRLGVFVLGSVGTDRDVALSEFDLARSSCFNNEPRDLRWRKKARKSKLVLVVSAVLNSLDCWFTEKSLFCRTAAIPCSHHTHFFFKTMKPTKIFKSTTADAVTFAFLLSWACCDFSVALLLVWSTRIPWVELLEYIQHVNKHNMSDKHQLGTWNMSTCQL